MADEEGDDEYVSEQVQEIVKHAMNQTLQNAVYSKDKVNSWCNQLLDSCLKELAKLNKPFKYIVTCVIMQKNGAPLSTAATCWWDLKTDGLTCVQVGKDTLDSVLGRSSPLLGDPFDEVQPRQFLAKELPVFTDKLGVDAFFDVVRRGQPAVFRTAGIGWSLVNQSCREFAARWPEGKMSKQYQTHDMRVALSDPGWAEKKPSSIGEHATSAPYVWHVKDRVSKEMKKSVQDLLFPAGIAMESLPWLEGRHKALEHHVADSMEFWLQPARAGTLAHNDAYCVNVMSVQLSGHKQWKLMTMPKVDSIGDMFDEFDGGIWRDPNRTFDPDYIYTLGPGEGILFPPGMMHETLSVSDTECTTSVTFNIPIPMSAKYVRNLLPRLSLSTEFGDCLWDRWEPTVTLGLGGRWTAERLDGGKLAGERAAEIMALVDGDGDGMVDSEEVLHWLETHPRAAPFRNADSNPDAKLAFSKGATLGQDAIHDLLQLRAKDSVAYWDRNNDGIATEGEIHEALWQWHVVVTRRRIADLALGEDSDPGSDGFHLRAAAAAKLFNKLYRSGKADVRSDSRVNEDEL